MKRLLYIISAFVLVACSGELFNGEEPEVPGSQILPVVCLDPVGLPPGATKALVDNSTAVSIEANALRIDQGGTSWSQAYLTEATVSSSSDDGARSMYLNPVQAYSEEKSATMVSWYPRTCSLHKDDDGNAVTIKFEDFKTNRGENVYTEGNGTFSLNFTGLDGSKDIMVSNVVMGNKDSNPFGSSNLMTYNHFMSAVKVYAYVEQSAQDVSMWGALRKVVVKNQPSEVSVTLPGPSGPGSSEATFSGNADFPLIKTAMFGDADQDPEIAPDAPVLDVSNDSENPIYLGYALIKPKEDDDETLKLDIHTDAGMISVDVPMSLGEGNSKVNYFQAGFIYTVNICFNTENAIAAVVLKSGNEHYYDLSAGMEFDGDIHDYQFANCYIVHPELKRTDEKGNSVTYDGYAFNASVVGNGPLGLYSNSGFDRNTVEIEPVRAGLLWESSQGLVTQVELIYGYVRFKVKSEAEGNAVIAVYDSQRRVLWSWHIWITDKPQDVTYTVNGQDIVLLDRNLGATAVGSGDGLATYGLYYQWGRKDPSMGPPDADYRPQSTQTSAYYDYYGDLWNYAGVVTMAQPTVRDGVENPMYLVMPTDFSMTTYQYDWLYTNIDILWGDYDHSAQGGTSTRQKTIYDPCPFGYMVPQDEISTLFASTATPGNNGFTISGRIVDDKGTSDKSDDVVLNGSYQSFFPFAGYKGVDKGVSSLTGAWKYVGKKGDYMSSKIEPNGHRSRTYISDLPKWTEYGADNDDDDGNGDGSCTYVSQVYTDETANRRTAASVRCVKRTSALNATQYLNLSGDRTYCFAGDVINFTYKIEALGGDTIKEAYVDLNETTDISVNGLGKNVTINKTSLNGTFTHTAALTSGLERYRLVSTTTKGVTSRISHAVRVFEVEELKVNNVDFVENTTTCSYGNKYSVSFVLKGLESDFSIYINGVEATKGTVVNANGLASMPYTVSGVYIPSHLNIQIRDANGKLACTKTYHVKMNAINSYTKGTVVSKATDLEAGALYMIIPQDLSGYCLAYDPSSKELILNREANTIDAIAANENNVFLFHRDDTRAGGVAANYHSVSAGAWMSMKADGFFKKDFAFGPESEAAYTTCANNWDSQTGNDIDLYYEKSGEFFIYNNYTLGWSVTGNSTYKYKWLIYKVTVN